MYWQAFPTSSGLLSEKSDDSLFFLDVGQPKKPESTGEHPPTQLKQSFIWLGEILDLWKHSNIQSYENSLLWAAGWIFLLIITIYIYFSLHFPLNLISFPVPEPVEGKKRKGKASRPLRIDLILQHDSLVPPPKESVSIVYIPFCLLIKIS